MKVGISACLLGHRVRFDGADKKSSICSSVLSEWLEFIPICPEVEIGLGVPREPIRLVEENNQVRVKNVSDHSRDYTDQLHALADQKSLELSELCGYIFMQKSPSCGVFGVKIYHPNGQPVGQQGIGAFAYQLKHHHPWLPMEEAVRMDDAALCENFITRVYAIHDWKKNVLRASSATRLVVFHTRYQLLLQVHSLSHFEQLEQLMGDVGTQSTEAVLNTYLKLFISCLAQVTKISNHVSMLLHILGFLADMLPAEVSHWIIELIDQYKEQKVPLVVPITALKHHIELHQVEYLLKQKYLAPYPHELGFRATL